ncbi:MAG: hypothetical protein AAFY19_08170, partial [Pseudomonadota bacterium]
LLLGDIGSRIGETRRPLSAKQLKELFRLVEFELAGPDGDFANAVATGLLEAVFESSISGGFDLETIKQIIGRRARDYLHSWAESHGRDVSSIQAALIRAGQGGWAMTPSARSTSLAAPDCGLI